MSDLRAAVALMTAEHNNMDAEAKALVSELDRDQLETVALMLAGTAAALMFNEACEHVDDYDAALGYVDALLKEDGLEAA